MAILNVILLLKLPYSLQQQITEGMYVPKPSIIKISFVVRESQLLSSEIDKMNITGNNHHKYLCIFSMFEKKIACFVSS